MTAELFQLLDRADHHHLLHVLGDPHRQGGAPKPAAADSPVVSVCQPVVEALLLDIGGNPVGLSIVGQQLLLDFGHLYKPAGNSLHVGSHPELVYEVIVSVELRSKAAFSCFV